MQHISRLYRIPRGRSICDQLNVDFVGVQFWNQGDGQFQKKYIIVPDLKEPAGNRTGTVTYYYFKNLSKLFSGIRGRPRKMTYSTLMNDYVWPGHWYCSRVLLDV